MTAPAEVHLVIVELGAVLVGLALLARVANRVGFSGIPLYLLAGLAFGRGGIAPLKLSQDFIGLGAEIGVLLLLFMLGLEYTPSELKKSLRAGLPSGIADAVLNFTPGVVAGLLLGWKPLAAVLLGGVTYCSSSGIIAKVLSDLKRLNNPETAGVLSILVIEDQPQMRRNLSTILEMEGYEVLTAENGKRGVACAHEEFPDLVLCDVMMPELDGYGVLQLLRQHKGTATTPFLFLTAKGEKPDIRAGMNLGADDYLVKPVIKSELLAAIHARLERQQAHATELQQQLANSSSFNPDFASPKPLETLGLTPREAEVLLWVAQGKSNGEIAIICGMAEKTVKRHLGNVFEKLGVENRNAAARRAFETLPRA